MEPEDALDAISEFLRPNTHKAMDVDWKQFAGAVFRVVVPSMRDPLIRRVRATAARVAHRGAHFVDEVKEGSGVSVWQTQYARPDGME
jgi:hypothetical protein